MCLVAISLHRLELCTLDSSASRLDMTRWAARNGPTNARGSHGTGTNVPDPFALDLLFNI